MSGGVMRTLILLFNNAATFAKMSGQDCINEELARKAVMKQRKDLQTRLNQRYRRALENVLKERMLLGGDSEPVEDEMLTNDLLLSYEDEAGAWFDAHPNLLPLLRG